MASSISARTLGALFRAYSEYEAPPLSIRDSDHLFDFQLSLRNPKQFGAATLYVMGIASSMKVTVKAINKLNDLNILRSSNQSLGNGMRGIDDIIVTEVISSDFSRKMKMLSVSQQKSLIMLLFAWQEELVRWRVLDEEINEVKTIILEERMHGSEEIGHLEVRLMELKGIWRLKPSLRLQRSTTEEALPEYTPRYEN
jgi:hypothetical protein